MTDSEKRLRLFTVASALSLEAQRHLARALLEIIAVQGSEEQFRRARQAITAAHEYENETRGA